jgi:hypothetical protein
MGPHWSDAGQESIRARRIRHARETTAALERVRSDPTPDNVVALHELHARHLCELGDEESGARAAERADRVRARVRDRPSPTGARGRTAHDVQRKRPDDDARRDETDLAENRLPAPPAPGERTQPARATGQIQVQRAQAGAQRARAQLRRLAEGDERGAAHAALEQSASERSAAAERRLLDAGERSAASAVRSPPREGEELVDGRAGRADKRDRIADEREKIADERESRASERDKHADKREAAADKREKRADRREKDADERERLADRRDEITVTRERIADELDRRFGQRDDVAQELEHAAKDGTETESR